MTDIAGGEIKIEDIKEVEIEDLLGRDQIEPRPDLLKKNIYEKVVMVTGSGGSIGSELCRQILKQEPKRLILYEQHEWALYNIDSELEGGRGLLSGYGDLNKPDRIVPILGTVLDQRRLEEVCTAFGVNTIYHAAAYKHVPIVENNPSEAVNNNILGTLRAANAALKTDVETFVLVSTDKAVRPTNTMGASKRFAELILQGLSGQESVKTCFTMVRFGNVLESSGSVIPLFRKQIRQGGPVTVTDPKIIRYFMTIPEAAQLVIQAGAMGEGGDVFVLDMGEPVRILDLARRMIRLSGLEIRDQDNPDGDIEIQFTGLRPGEKLFEELLIGDDVQSTSHPLIMKANEEVIAWNELQVFIDALSDALEKYDQQEIRKILTEAISGFRPQCGIEDIIYKVKGNAFDSEKAGGSG
jgi:FlaA1/EpsC-like NDP-sugar epimerase